MKNYHELHLECDALLLAAVLKKFRNMPRRLWFVS